jgi:hypothetical protein
MKFTNEQIDFMHYEIQNNFPHAKFIQITKNRFKEEGRDFDKEFSEYQKKTNAESAG